MKLKLFSVKLLGYFVEKHQWLCQFFLTASTRMVFVVCQELPVKHCL